MAGNIAIELSESNVNIANNTSDVTAVVVYYGNGVSWNNSPCPVSLTLDGTTYSGTSTFSTSTSRQVLMTKTKTVTHSSDGSKSVSASASFATDVSLGTLTASNSLKLTTIPRASSISANKTSVELGSSVTFTITRASTSFTHTIQAGVDGKLNWTNIATGVTTSKAWDLPTNWASYFPNGQKLKIRVITYSGSTQIGVKEMTSLSVTAPSSMAPSATLVISDPTGLATTYGGYIKGKSKIQATATDTFQYGTSAKSRALIVNGVTYNAATATTPDVINTIPQTVSYTVTDGRGLSYSTSQTLPTYDWHTPSITGFSAQRCTQAGVIDEDGAYCKVEFSYDIATVNNKNTKSAVVKYKTHSASSYTSKNVTLSNYSGTVSTIVPTSTESMFDILLEIADAFATSSASTTIGTAYTLVDYHTSGRGIAFGKVAEDANLMDINLPILARNVMNMASQLKTSFKSSVAMGSYGASASTVDGLVTELRYSSGCMGSASIGTAYTKDGITIGTGWYNFIYSPHRSGGANGAASGDNCNYGNLILMGMTVSGSYLIRVSSATISEVRRLANYGDTAWKTLETNFNYIKRDGVVYVDFYKTNQSLSTSWTTIGTLPSGYRPNHNLYGAAMSLTTTPIAYFINSSSGVVQMRTATGSGSYVTAFSVSYPVL